jgi:uncharacterized protein (TIRG00374 family)
MKKLHGLTFLLGVALLAFLTWKIGVRELWRELRLLGWGLVPIVLSEGIAEFLHTISWRYCLSGRHRSIPLMRLFRISMAGYAINYLTPTASMGGDVAKVSLLSQTHKGPEAITGVLIGKLSFALAHLLFVFIGSAVILWQIALPRQIWIALLISSSLLAIGIGLFLLIQKHGKLGAFIRWFVKRYPGKEKLRRIARAVNEVDEALKSFYRERPWGLSLSVLWHLAGYSVGMFPTWYFLHFLAGGSSFAIAAGAWFLATWFDLLVFMVPMNMGVLEGTRVMVFRAIGYNSLLGMTYGVAFRLTQLFWAGFGMVTYGLLIPRRVASANLSSSQKSDQLPEREGHGRSVSS